MSLRAVITLAILVMGIRVPVEAGERLQVVVSIAPLQWLVEQVGGETVEVAILVAPGESPTTYTPTDAQVTKLMQARVFFRVGVPFEDGPWFSAVRKMGRLRIVDLRDGIEIQAGDPHIWLSPRLLSIEAETVAAALGRGNSEYRPEYRENLERLQARLQVLDEEIRQRLSPYSGRSFFVFHPSWSYFAQEYGLRQIAIEREGREPSDREMTRLQQAARAARISTVFVQPQIEGRGAEAFAQAIDARLERLDPLAVDVAANLSEVTAKLIAAFREGEGRVP